MSAITPRIGPVLGSLAMIPYLSRMKDLQEKHKKLTGKDRWSINGHCFYQDLYLGPRNGPPIHESLQEEATELLHLVLAQVEKVREVSQKTIPLLIYLDTYGVYVYSLNSIVDLDQETIKSNLAGKADPEKLEKLFNRFEQVRPTIRQFIAYKLLK